MDLVNTHKQNVGYVPINTKHTLNVLINTNIPMSHYTSLTSRTHTSSTVPSPQTP